MASATRASGQAGQEALQELLAGMRDEYARTLPEKLAHIELLWREVAGGSDSRRDELLRTAHSMAGAAATFGLPRVGDAALELERVLQPLCAHGAVPTDGDKSQVEDRIAQLLRVSPNREMKRSRADDIAERP